MGRIDFRTGDLSKRLGGLVGARWKQTPYVRRYVIPANPQTVDQMLVRNAWAFLVAMGRRINSTILKVYTIPKPKAMSAFNRFMQINKAQIDGGLLTYSTVKTAAGGLYLEEPVGCSIAPPCAIATVDWQIGLQGEALAGDIAIACCYNETQDSWGFATTALRSDNTVDVTLDVAIDDVVHAWVFMVQGTDISSESVYALGEVV